MNTNFKDRRILVIGAGLSGRGAAEFLHRQGAHVLLYDGNPQADIAGLPLEKAFLGSLPSLATLALDGLVVSPGFPLDRAPVPEGQALHIPLIGEVELAYRHTDNPFIAITGTNGKTTTTSLVGYMLRHAGKKVVVGGNIGIPLTEQVPHLKPGEWVVAEVSSFQLETVETFAPQIAVVLNLTPDHLDRHKTMANYRAAKTNIFRFQTSENWTILNDDDLEVRAMAEETPARAIGFSRLRELSEGAFLRQERMIMRLDGRETDYSSVRDLTIKGPHNWENALAALAVGHLLNLHPDDIREALKSFPGVPHRLEPAGEVNGVTYINDSKGTNPDSTLKALEAYDKPLILIAGGYNKQSSFKELAEAIQKRVKAVVLVGQTADILAKALDEVGFHNYHPVETFEETVEKAAKLAKAGDVVLLSPACASWGMFKNFEERGELFKDLVQRLRR